MTTDDALFEAWKKAVDKEIASYCGLAADDLPDVDYRSMYDDGEEPEAAAEYAIRNAHES